MSVPIRPNPLGITKNKKPLTFTAKESNSTVKISVFQEQSDIPVENGYQIQSSISGLRYKKNNGNWRKYELNEVITLEKVNDYIQFENTLNTLSHNINTDHVRFVMTGKIESSGNVMSMLNYSNDTISFCFFSLFKDCNALITPPELPSLKVKIFSYGKMFCGCTSLVQIPELPATSLYDECYREMFRGCNSLTSIPINALKATNLGTSCYYLMFSDCVSLTNMPNLPAILLTTNCYLGMFQNCTSLVTVTNLPAQIIEQGCYAHMFKGCVSLTSSPNLNAINFIGNSQCFEMFAGCISLINPPELPATTLAPSCYFSMFAGCISLVNAPELPARDIATFCYKEMFSGCFSLTQAPELPSTLMKQECYRGMFKDCVSLVTPPSELRGNTMSLMCYREMFQGCTALSSVPIIDAKKAAVQCFYSMFNGCTSLTSFNQILPGGNIINYTSCYMGMFANCSNLVSVPSEMLPATDVGTQSYRQMFYNCTSLVEAPELPATAVGYDSYREMFQGCTSLVNAPALPAMTLENGCYQNMFKNCSSLISAPPYLPATTLYNSCYRSMFEGCNSLIDVPTLPSNVLSDSCYYWMFLGDYNINKLDVDFENWSNSDATNDWVKYLFQDGVFLKPENLPEEYGYSRIPVNFTPFDKNKPLTLTAVESSTVKITQNGSPRSLNVYYKKNNGEWIQYDVDTVIDLNEGDFVQFKNTTTNQFSTGKDDFYGFVMTGKIKASGNVQSLVNFSNTANWYAFRKLFQNCRSLIEAPTVLPAKHVLGYAYASMFGKTSITNMPIMLAEDFGDEACYYMFEECPITYAKLLDKKENNGKACFERIFNNCQSLKVIDVDFTVWDTVKNNEEHKYWCYGTPSDITFLKKRELRKTFNNNLAIHYGWNVYNPLKFIQASGTQYVDTNITPSGNFEIEVYCTGVLNFGCRSAELQNGFGFSLGINNVNFMFGDDSYSYSKTGIGNNKNIIKYGTDGKFYVNNELVYSSQSSVSQYYPLYAFALNSNGTPIYNGAYPSKIFRIKMWRDGVLVSDIIPVDADGGHLFDRFNNICFPNSGTGDFVI